MHRSTITGTGLALTLAATLLAAPAGATEPGPTDSATPTTQAPAKPAFRNSCNPAVATLPSAVVGDPLVQPGARAGTALGLYVWHDGEGWRVRLTHPEQVTTTDASGATTTKATRIEVAGRITASRPLSAVRPVRLEARQRGEHVAVQRPGRRTMTFRFINYGGIDGVDFRAGCAGRVTISAWTVTRNPDRTVTRTALPVFLGSARSQVTEPAAAANPGLLPGDATATRVRILRAPTPAA